MQREYTARLATTDDVAAGAPALARAFEDDPLFRWILPNDAKRLGALNVLFDVLVRRSMKIDFHEAYTTPDVAGMALWGRPGAWRLPTKLMLPSMPRMIRAMGLGATMRFMRVMHKVEKTHPAEPHWYLACLGTDPPKQRTGVGKTLVAPVLERCDRERLPAYLETQKPENVPYYERFGFQVSGEFDIVEGGPHIWLMWRDPM
jgi:GNAT superfamily N-acetyltransferase